MRKPEEHPDKSSDVKMDCDTCIPTIESDVEMKEVKEEEEEDSQMDMAKFQEKGLQSSLASPGRKAGSIPTWKEVVGIVRWREDIEI